MWTGWEGNDTTSGPGKDRLGLLALRWLARLTAEAFRIPLQGELASQQFDFASQSINALCLRAMVTAVSRATAPLALHPSEVTANHAAPVAARPCEQCCASCSPKAARELTRVGNLLKCAHSPRRQRVTGGRRAGSIWPVGSSGDLQSCGGGTPLTEARYATRPATRTACSMDYPYRFEPDEVSATDLSISDANEKKLFQTNAGRVFGSS